ncbi:MAG: glycosyltransferase family 39 protein [Ignavibacterium sp.]|nr:glycosyltransferase family 39 protein [Ignavibacterium sp.]
MRKKIFFVILTIAILVRLYHIDFPIAGWHSWRQADTAAIARNYFENGFRFFYPQIDWGGNSKGFVETEFPIYPFIVSILYSIFGLHEGLGRFVSVLFSLFTIYGLYLLTMKYFSETIALWSVFIYSIIPLNIYYSRTFMPESTLLMCSVWGVYFFSQWLDLEKTKYFYFSAFFISLAILVKLPTLYIGLPLLYLALLKFGKTTFKNKMLFLYVFIVLLPVVAWYYHAHQLYIRYGHSFGIWDFGKGKWGNFELLLTLKFYNDIFFKSIAERHFTYAGFIPFIIGIFLPRNNLKERLFDFWLIAVVVYFLIVAKGNQIHEYYQLPFVLPGVVYIGKVYAKYVDIKSLSSSFLKNRFLFTLLSLCLVGTILLSYLRYDRFMKGENYNSYIFRLAEVVQKTSKTSDLIISANENPLILYLCHRKGWRCSIDQLNIGYLNYMTNGGAKYLIVEKVETNTPDKQKKVNEWKIKYKIVYDDDDFMIFSLN